MKHLMGYFKRSFVACDQVEAYRGNCISGKDIYPITYSGIDALISIDMKKERKFLITNVLRKGAHSNIIKPKIVNEQKLLSKIITLGVNYL
jgi:hypothetical protein